MDQVELQALLADDTKEIEGDVEWVEDEFRSSAVSFRAEVKTRAEYPLFIKGTFNRRSRKLQFALIHRGLEGRLYGLCMGNNHPPVGRLHKHQMKHAYFPTDITAAAEDVLAVWQQFCAETKITHKGTMRVPPEMPGHGQLSFDDLAV